jgi:hypothetical protein
VLDVLCTALLLAEGRGSDPNQGNGLILIVGVIVLVVLMIGAAWYLLARATSRRGSGSGPVG